MLTLPHNLVVMTKDLRVLGGQFALGCENAKHDDAEIDKASDT